MRENRPRMRHRALTLFSLCLTLIGLAACTPAHTAADSPSRADAVLPSDLVCFQRGSIPIILSAPHGGRVRVPGSTERTTGLTVRDENVAEIALLTAQRLTDVLGAKPYFVIAEFSRKDADANRTPDQAYENPAGQAAYEAYHRALRSCVDECRARFGAAILIDIHGQARVPEAIIRGTRNGRTVSRLLAAGGNDALIGPDSLFGRLKKAGYTIIPDGPGDDPAQPLGHESVFDGGFIVGHYGSDNPDGVDAIQVEIGEQRTHSMPRFSRDLADAIAAFYEQYLQPAAPPQSPADAPR